MKRVLVTLAILALIPLLAGCGLFGMNTWSWRQKLVLEVETPHGTVSGGSVVQVKLHRVPRWLPSNNPGAILSDVKGEASFIEIAPGRYLFAVGGGGARHVFFPEPEISNQQAYDRLENFSGSAALPRKFWPTFVTFTDITDPKTVRRVDPDDLAATFGLGYRLRSVTLEITDEPVTRGEVEKVLPWLREIWPNSLDGNRFETIRSSNRFANSLSANSFSTEIGD